MPTSAACSVIEALPRSGVEAVRPPARLENVGGSLSSSVTVARESATHPFEEASQSLPAGPHASSISSTPAAWSTPNARFCPASVWQPLADWQRSISAADVKNGSRPRKDWNDAHPFTCQAMNSEYAVTVVPAGAVNVHFP